MSVNSPIIIQISGLRRIRFRDHARGAIGHSANYTVAAVIADDVCVAGGAGQELKTVATEALLLGMRHTTMVRCVCT